MSDIRTLELLAPARDAAIGRIAVLAGADAVYIGAPAFGARAAATNSIDDIAALASFAHAYRAKVYVTMNTILYEDELERAREMVWALYRAGVDALIVQDMAYLEMKLPPIALHASTQCDVRTPAKAAWLARAGFSQIVLPREFTLSEIKAAREAAGVPVEVFVHGALCVSYSGDCQAGFAAMKRSANRGECPQMCRLPYEITDVRGRVVAPAKHYLSLRDLNQSRNLEALVEAGASSFKIEGRLKDARYVANVTAAYSRRLDEIAAASGGTLTRSSAGRSVCAFTPALDRTFNRGYTSYFLRRPERMASIDTPKWAGLPVATVTGVSNKYITVRAEAAFSNGDGLGFFDRSGRYAGFRLNRAEGDRLYPATMPEGLMAGMTIYRNSDKAFFDILDAPDAGCRRTIRVDFALRATGPGSFAISASDERGCRVTLAVDCELQEARSAQEDRRRDVLCKLGGTIYEAGTVEDSLGAVFVPVSVLAEARRRVIALLDNNAADTYHYDRRRGMTPEEDAFAGEKPLDYHWNVANSLAERFYRSHGAEIASHAIEVEKPAGDEVTVMNTRYCIRRELGACLRRRDEAAKLPDPCFLRNESGLYRLDFDCGNCGMKVVKINRPK